MVDDTLCDMSGEINKKKKKRVKIYNECQPQNITMEAKNVMNNRRSKLHQMVWQQDIYCEVIKQPKETIFNQFFNIATETM